MTTPKNMRNMRQMRQIWGVDGLHLFCSGSGFTKQILDRPNGDFCLMLPHVRHVTPNCLNNNTKNMTIMRIHEEGLFIGFSLPRLKMGMRSRPKHEAVMRQHEDDPHVFRGVGHSNPIFLTYSYYRFSRRLAWS